LRTAAGTAILALAATLTVVDEQRTAPPAPTPTTAVAEVGAPTTPTPTRRPRPHRPVRPAVPERLRIPALGVDAPVVPIAADDQVLRPPPDPQQVGWWSTGARPGAHHGAALLTGHSVSAGDGALDHLADLTPGARVTLTVQPTTTGAARRLRYQVETVTTYDRAELARRAPELFATSGPPRLVIVTCGDFDGREYLGNVVVRARLLGAG
jgi:sortase (surface protein transpeptidase)